MRAKSEETQNMFSIKVNRKEEVESPFSLYYETGKNLSVLNIS